MTAAKYWDAASGTWVPITSVQGPQGPPGAAGAPGAAGPPTLDFQRIWCTANAYRTASFTGTVTYHILEVTATMAAPSLVINYSSAVPFWWEITHTNGLIRKDDAVYHYIYSGFQISPSDQDGLQQEIGIFTGRSDVMQFGSVTTRKTFRCAAGSYVVQAIMGGGNGGTWNYMKNSNCYLEARAWAQ